jgi:hypothetical protein
VQVTVYDRYDRAGGLLTYGIPGFKLEKEVVVRRNQQLEEGGVAFVLNCNVGEDIGFDEIRGKARRRADRHRRLQEPRPAGAGRRCGRDRARDRLPDRVEPEELWRRGAGIRRRRR